MPFKYSSAAASCIENLWIRLWSLIHIHWEYFALLFYPKDLFYEKPFLITPWIISPEGIFGILLILCFILSMFFTISILLINRTIDRNRDWADEERFYKNELKFASQSHRFLNNLGGYYARIQDYEKATLYFQKSKKSGNSAEAYYNLAVLYLELIQVNNKEEQKLVGGIIFTV